MYDRTRQHASSTTDEHRPRSTEVTPRGLAATVLLMAAVPAVAWALTHPMTVAALAVGAALPTVVRFVRARVDARSTTLRTAADAAAAGGDRE